MNTAIAEADMTAQTTLQARIAQEMASFQKNIEELNMLKMVSEDLRRYKRLLQVKKFD